jgi:hypothetical protein
VVWAVLAAAPDWGAVAGGPLSQCLELPADPGQNGGGSLSASLRGAGSAGGGGGSGSGR